MSGLTRYVITDPDDVEAKVFKDQLDKALTNRNERRAAGMVRAFQKDADYQRLRRAAFPGMAPGQTYPRSQEDRYNKAVVKIYASAAAGQDFPSLARLIAPTPTIKQALPPRFRSRAGFLIFVATVKLLHDRGASQVALGKSYGFTIDRRRCRMIAFLLKIAERMGRERRHRGFIRARWLQAQTEAAEYVEHGLLTGGGKAS